MSLEMIRTTILAVGWPILVIISILIVYKAHNFYKKTQKLALGKFVLAQTISIVISMYSLGIISTAFMFCKVGTGVLIVLPIFIIWFVMIIGILILSEKWKDEAAKINILYYRIKERTKKLKQEKNKLTHIAQNMDTGAILLDHSGKPMFINREAREIINPKVSDENQLLKLLFKKFSKYDLKSCVGKCVEGNPCNITNIEIKDKLYEIYLRCLIDHSVEQNYFGHFIWIRDVTEEKTLEQAKNKFLTVVSHKLRTPLAGIRGFIDLISKDKNGKLSSQQKEYLNDTQKCIKITVDLINQLFYASEAEIKKLKVNLKKTDLASLLKKVTSKIKELSKEKKCKFKINIPKNQKFILQTDNKLLSKTIFTILENAIIYSNNTDNKSIKNIEINISKENDEYIISVKDKGIGIPETDNKRIFQKFYRSENALKVHTEGTGLNLNIANDIVNSLGGKIWFKSKLDKGTQFFLTLPIKLSKQKIRLK